MAGNVSEKAVFFDAIKACDGGTVAYILQTFDDAKEWTNDEGNTGLICAVVAGDPTVVQILLDAEADVNAEGNHQTTAIAFAKDNAVITTLLIQAGADVNHRNVYGTTALMLAAWDGPTEVVQMLVDVGAQVSAQDESGISARQYAADADTPRPDVVKYLELAERQEEERAVSRDVKEEETLADTFNQEAAVEEAPVAEVPAEPEPETEEEAAARIKAEEAKLKEEMEERKKATSKNVKSLRDRLKGANLIE